MYCLNEKFQNTALSGVVTRVSLLAANGDCKSPESGRRFSFSRYVIFVRR